MISGFGLAVAFLGASCAPDSEARDLEEPALVNLTSRWMMDGLLGGPFDLVSRVSKVGYGGL